MRFERLVIEADENTFSLDFHPCLTVICGVGRLEREGVISELVGSLSSSRPGVHAEIVADNGNRFAIFRPFGARARVVDVDTAADVSARFADHDGHVDLLAVADLDPRSAKRVLRMTAADLAATSHHDEHVRRLARADPDELWEAAARVAHARAELDQAAKDAGSEPEDAAVVAQIEEQHQRFEGAQARAEKLRRASFIGGALAALAAVPSATLVSQMAAMACVLLAVTVTVISFIQNRRVQQARKAEREALALAGAESYLGFHLQRVNGLLQSGQARERLVEAGTEHESAIAGWRQLAGDIDPEWADENRADIDTMSTQLRGATHLESGPHALGDDDPLAALAHALRQHLARVRSLGPAGESLPLILDDALVGLDPPVKASLLELLGTASDNQQIVFLTDDPEVVAWAQLEELTGAVAVLNHGGEPENTTVDMTGAAINVA